jgi:hypothetical protein
LKTSFLKGYGNETGNLQVVDNCWAVAVIVSGHSK